MTPRELIGRFLKDLNALDDKTKNELLKNASITAAKISELLSAFGQQRDLTSGYRPHSYNKMIGGAPNSNHIRCLAVDLEDGDKMLGKWCENNQSRLAELGLYMESLLGNESLNKYGTHNTPGKSPWVHLQTCPPKSGNRIFLP